MPRHPREHLFWPNVIGYLRVVLAMACLYYMPLHPCTCCLYTISCLLDALDGYTACISQQVTPFGAVLDMIIDRCATSCLLVFLSTAMPRWAIVFQGLIALDLSSHYMHIYATLVVGGAGSSYKDVNKSQNWLLNLYYSNKIVLFTLCALNELFFIALYLLSFSSLVPPHPPVDTSLPRQIFPFSAAALEMARANNMDPYWPFVFASVSSPFMATKQLINLVQLIQASRWLADVDLQARKEKGRKN